MLYSEGYGRSGGLLGVAGATLLYADTTGLGGVAVAGYTSGQQAFVASTGYVYTLCASVGTADAKYIVAASGDGARQWAALEVLNAGVFTSDELDLTVLNAATTIVPALTGKRYLANRVSTCVTAVGGSLSTLATVRFLAGTGILVVSGTAFFSAAMFTLGPGAYLTGNAGNGVTSTVIPANTAGVFDVSNAATGTGLTYKGKATLIGAFVS